MNRSDNSTINSRLESSRPRDAPAATAALRLVGSIMPGTLFLVSTPIGNLEDMTARALRVLRDADLVAAEDTRRTHKLLAHYGIAVRTVSLHAHNEAARIPRLIEQLKGGARIALVSDAGTPAVADPGHRLIRAAIDAGIHIEPIPGPSALLAAVVASGFPADSFCFLGFPPTRPSDRKAWLARLAELGTVVVFFEAPHRILTTLEDVRRVVGDRQVAVARELTKIHEEFIRGPISVVRDKITQPPRGEFSVVLDVRDRDEGRDSLPARRPDPGDLAREVGLLTESGLSRRRAVATVARRHSVGANELYRLLERSKSQ